MKLTVERVKELVEEQDYQTGENFFEYHVLNTDEVRDLLLEGYLDVLSEETLEEIKEDELEMFCFRDLTMNLTDLDEDSAPLYLEIFYNKLTDILNSNENYMQQFLESVNIR